MRTDAPLHRPWVGLLTCKAIEGLNLRLRQACRVCKSVYLVDQGNGCLFRKILSLGYLTHAEKGLLQDARKEVDQVHYLHSEPAFRIEEQRRREGAIAVVAREDCHRAEKVVCRANAAHLQAQVLVGQRRGSHDCRVSCLDRPCALGAELAGRPSGKLRRVCAAVLDVAHVV